MPEGEAFDAQEGHSDVLLVRGQAVVGEHFVNHVDWPTVKTEARSEHTSDDGGIGVCVAAELDDLPKCPIQEVLLAICIKFKKEVKCQDDGVLHESIQVSCHITV